MADKPSLESLYSGPGDSKPSLEDLYSGQKKPDLTIWDVPGRALSNLGPSAGRFVQSMVQPVLHPIETAQNVGRLGLGVGEKLGIPGTAGYGQYADAVGQFFKERYGGYENVKRTLADDPVGFAADIATLATGGELALARVPGVVGKVGEVSGQVAKYTNPLNVTKAIPSAGRLASEAGGLVTGKGSETYRGLAQTGFEGGQAAATAERNLRQPEAMAPQIVAKARSALADMFAERSANYQKFQQQFDARSVRPLDFTDIDAAITRNENIGKFRGHDVAQLAGENELTAPQQMLSEIKRNVNQWRMLPNQFHTGPGLDALKQHIGGKIDWKNRPDAANKVAQDVYHAIRDTIAKQDRKYAAAMKDYQEATDLLQQVEKTLSLGKKASEDTALRKLLSTTRSDVNTNFGRRRSLAEELNKRDPSIMPALYGQSAAPLAPGGLARGAAGLGGLGGIYEYGLNPKLIAALMATSPRLWGEASLLAGKGARKVKEAIPSQILQQIGKLNPDVLRRTLLLMGEAGSKPPLRIDVGAPPGTPVEGG